MSLYRADFVAAGEERPAAQWHLPLTSAAVVYLVGRLDMN